MATRAKEGTRRKGRSTQGRVSGIRFDWDAHGCDGYAVPVQDRSHEDSGDLIAAKIHRSWDEESDGSDGEDPEESDEESDDASDPESEAEEAEEAEEK